MVNHSGDVSENEARALWRRATELQQSDEERGLREDALPPGSLDKVPMERVLEAAAEAGISTENVLLAVAERNLVDADEIRPNRWSARWLRKLVSETGAIEVSRVLRAPVEVVASATEKVTSTDAYKVVLENQLKGESDGAVVFVYRSHGVSIGKSSWFHSALQMGDVRVILVMIRRIRKTTQLRIRAPMYDRGLNLALAGGSTGGLGAAGTAGGAAVGQAVAGVVGTVAIPAAVAAGVVGALVGAGVGMWGFRRLYSWGWGKGQSAVERLAQAIAAEAEGRGGAAVIQGLPKE